MSTHQNSKQRFLSVNEHSTFAQILCAEEFMELLARYLQRLGLMWEYRAMIYVSPMFRQFAHSKVGRKLCTIRPTPWYAVELHGGYHVEIWASKGLDTHLRMFYRHGRYVGRQYFNGDTMESFEWVDGYNLNNTVNVVYYLTNIGHVDKHGPFNDWSRKTLIKLFGEDGWENFWEDHDY